MTATDPKQLTANFRLSEFERSETATQHGIDNSVPVALLPNIKRLAEFLQELRDTLNLKRIVISSGYRGVALNKMVGGVTTSSHSQALAADISVPGMTTEELFQAICNSGLEFDQVIQEFGRWVHVGLSTDKPRGQKLRATKNSAQKTVYTLV
ncbi:Peptidase M15 [compost metagenome]